MSRRKYIIGILTFTWMLCIVSFALAQAGATPQAAIEEEILVLTKAQLPDASWSADAEIGDYLAIGENEAYRVEWENGPGSAFTIMFCLQCCEHRRQDILTVGDLHLTLSENGDIAVECERIEGDAELSYLPFNDGAWHQITIMCTGRQLRFYRDGILAKQSNVTLESLPRSGEPLAVSIGGGFHGNLADIRIANKVLQAKDLPAAQLPFSAPQADVAWDYHRGIAFDRRQYDPGVGAPNYLPELPFASEQSVYDQDLVNAAELGFEYVKVLFTPSFYMAEDGTMTSDGMEYMQNVVDRVLQSGCAALICIHPEAAFKRYYLGSWKNFETLLRFYENLGAFIASNPAWTADRVALQLMTEPFGNLGNWGMMHTRMWAAARRGAPEPTLVLSADINASDGNHMYAVERLIPVPDSNVYYSFTTYEPLEIGFNYLQGGIWETIGPIPYPVTPEEMESGMDIALSGVAEDSRQTASQLLRDYAAAGYDAQWFMRRAEYVDTWSRSYGSKLRLMCSEFGCLDGDIFWPRIGGADPLARCNMIRDLRSSFDAFGISWTYWSYNEVFTVLDPQTRIPFSPVNLAESYDSDMMEALGMAP